MRKHHPENERSKRDYFTYLEQAKGMAPGSVDQAAAAIWQFEESTNYRDFRKFHRNQAVAFKERLQRHVNPATGKPLAKATIHSRLMALKDFVIWLAGRPGYRSRITYADADYFKPSANDERIARAVRTRPGPTLEQIIAVVQSMPAVTILDRRDRAVLAFAAVSGARDNAIASFSLKHVDSIRRSIFQDARSVRTKNAKTFTSSYFPVGAELELIVASWIDELTKLGYGPDDPLFPATEVKPGEDRKFAATGLRRSHWKDAGPIRRILKQAFERAGLPYYNPHSLRNTLAVWCEKICRTPEEWKACSQNFGHSSPMTTYTSYGQVSPHRQAEILDALVGAKPLGSSTSPQTLRLEEDQVLQIIAGLAKAKADEDA